MLPSQFLQFATSYHLLPSLTILYLLHMIFWPLREAKHRHGASDAEPSWTSTLFPMSANGRCGLPRFASFCELSTISISTSRCKVNKAVPKEAYIQCAEASLLWISEFHLEFPSQICTKICKKQKQKHISLSKFKTGWSVADRRRPTFWSFWPRALRCPRGAGTWKTSIFGVKKSKIFKTLRDIVLHCLQLTAIELYELYE